MIMSKGSITSAPGPDGLRFAHLQSLLATAVGKSKFPELFRPFWRRVVEESNVLPPEFWYFPLQSNLTSLG